MRDVAEHRLKLERLRAELAAAWVEPVFNATKIADINKRLHAVVAEMPRVVKTRKPRAPLSLEARAARSAWVAAYWARRRLARGDAA
jgi:hypothetical protein